MFGREPNLPVDLMLGLKKSAPPGNAKDYAKKISDQLQQAFAMVKNKSTLQALRNQKRLNAKPGKRIHVTFEAKDPVLIYELEKYVPQAKEAKPASKLLNMWTGPHTIEKNMSDNKYSVLHATSKRKRELHVNHLYQYEY